jgi:uncharacterized membrane protein
VVSTEIALLIIATLVAALAFMLRHYFLRIERHMRRNHELFTILTRHELRIERLEQKTFGKIWSPPLRATDEEVSGE